MSKLTDGDIIKNMTVPVMSIEEIRELLENKDMIGIVRRLAEAAFFFFYHYIVKRLVDHSKEVEMP